MDKAVEDMTHTKENAVLGISERRTERGAFRKTPDLFPRRK